MTEEQLKKKIEKLQIEVQAMQNISALQDHYADKVIELIKLRRSLIRKVRKSK